MRTTIVLCAIGLVASGCASTQDRQNRQARTQGERVGEAVADKVAYVNELALYDAAQISLASLALERSTNPQVQSLARQIIDEHATHLKNVENYANAKVMTLAVADMGMVDAGSGATTNSIRNDAALAAMEKRSDEYGEEFHERYSKFLENRKQLSMLSGAEFDAKYLKRVEGGYENIDELVKKGFDRYSDDATMVMLLNHTQPMIRRQQDSVEHLRGQIES